MKDTTPNEIIALGLAFALVFLTIAGCDYVDSQVELNKAKSEAIKIEIRKPK